MCPPDTIKFKEGNDYSSNENTLISHSKTNPLKQRSNTQSKKSSNRCTNMAQLVLSNQKGNLLKDNMSIDSKEVLFNNDNIVNFGFQNKNSHNEVINHFVLNKPPENSKDDYSSFKSKTLFSICYNSSCNKFFFQPYKLISKQSPIQIAFNNSFQYRFLIYQKIEICSTLIDIIPNYIT